MVAWSDYLDGMTARVLGQYSRLGALLDPLTDRLLVLAGAIVAWHFELLPRWALAVLAVREAFMLVLTRLAFRHGLDLEINMLGRWAVWPVMSALALSPADGGLGHRRIASTWGLRSPSAPPPSTSRQASSAPREITLKLNLRIGLYSPSRPSPRKEASAAWTPSLTSVPSRTRNSRT